VRCFSWCRSTPRGPTAILLLALAFDREAIGKAFNLILQEAVPAVNLAVVIVFTSITLMLAAHSLVLAIRDRVRRNRDDLPGHQAHFDLVASLTAAGSAGVNSRGQNTNRKAGNPDGGSHRDIR
jgi:hypothetical protein